MKIEQLIEKITGQDEPIILTTIIKVFQHKIYEVDEFVEILDEMYDDGEDVEISEVMNHVYDGFVSDSDDYDIERNVLSIVGDDPIIDEKWDIEN